MIFFFWGGGRLAPAREVRSGALFGSASASRLLLALEASAVEPRCPGVCLTLTQCLKICVFREKGNDSLYKKPNTKSALG